MAEAAAEGAKEIADTLGATDRFSLRTLRADKAHGNDLLTADGFIFCAPENLASLSGEMKEFFDRCYYPALDRLNGLPYALLIAAGLVALLLACAAPLSTRRFSVWYLAGLVVAVVQAVRP